MASEREQLAKKIDEMRRDLEILIKREDEDNKNKLVMQYNDLSIQRDDAEKQLISIFNEIKKIKRGLRDTFNIICEHARYELTNDNCKTCRECGEVTYLRLQKNC